METLMHLGGAREAMASMVEHAILEANAADLMHLGLWLAALDPRVGDLSQFRFRTQLPRPYLHHYADACDMLVLALWCCVREFPEDDETARIGMLALVARLMPNTTTTVQLVNPWFWNTLLRGGVVRLGRCMLQILTAQPSDRDRSHWVMQLFKHALQPHTSPGVVEFAVTAFGLHLRPLELHALLGHTLCFSRGTHTWLERLDWPEGVLARVLLDRTLGDGTLTLLHLAALRCPRSYPLLLRLCGDGAARMRNLEGETPLEMVERRVWWVAPTADDRADELALRKAQAAAEARHDPLRRAALLLAGQRDPACALLSQLPRDLVMHVLVALVVAEDARVMYAPPVSFCASD